MSPQEAYIKGQVDMRNKIIKLWSGWITHTLGGYHRADRRDRKGYSNVAVEIRARCKTVKLEEI